MRLYKFCVVSAILSLLSLAACGTKTDTKPDIFNTLSQSEFLTNNAAEIECEDSEDYPEAQYYRLCFQINAVTIPSLDKAGEIALNLGLKIQALFKDSDWEVRTDPARFHYLRPDENGCTDILFFDFNGVDKFNSIDGDFPMQFAPLLSYSKMRQPDCAKT